MWVLDVPAEQGTWVVEQLGKNTEESADFWKRLMLLMGHNETCAACKELWESDQNWII